MTDTLRKQEHPHYYIYIQTCIHIQINTHTPRHVLQCFQPVSSAAPFSPNHTEWELLTEPKHVTYWFICLCAYVFVMMMMMVDRFLLTKTIKITTMNHFHFPIHSPSLALPFLKIFFVLVMRSFFANF